jgi:predicted  nucleic acid-binding Zn-ribbon protein
MTDLEFADYQHRYNDDPVVQRLCNFIFNGTVVEQLTDELDATKDELEFMERELKEARYEIKQLEDRTIVDMARDLMSQVENAEYYRKAANQERDRVLQVNKELTDKINVWKVIES